MPVEGYGSTHFFQAWRAYHIGQYFNTGILCIQTPYKYTEHVFIASSSQVWDVRADQVVRSIHGPYICGDGIDIWEDSVLTASWVAHDALQVLVF